MSAAEAMEPETTEAPFRSFGAILFFYVNEFSRRTRISIPLEWGAVPMPAWEQERREHNYARVVASLHGREPEDYDFDPRITEGRLNALAHWYMTDQPRSSLVEAFAEALNLRSESWSSFCRECRRTRNTLRRRWQARGLME